MRRSSGLLAALVITIPAAAAAAEQPVEHVEAAGARFPYVEAGEGEPVLFVHGAFADHRAWEPVREAVAADYRFIAYTQRQFGTDDWPEEPAYGQDVHEQDLVALLEAWGEPMHLVAWSYSGPIVLQAALDRPDLVRSVVIFEPTLDTVLQDKPEHEATLAEWGAGWGPVAEASEAGDDEEAIRLAIEYVFSLPEGGFETLPEGAQTMLLENAHTVPKLLAAPAPTPMTCEDLGGVEAPTLILYGPEALPFFQEAAKEVAACLPNATLDTIPGAGHGGPMQQTGAFVEKMLAFIESADGS